MTVPTMTTKATSSAASIDQVTLIFQGGLKSMETKPPINIAHPRSVTAGTRMRTLRG